MGFLQYSLTLTNGLKLYLSALLFVAILLSPQLSTLAFAPADNSPKTDAAVIKHTEAEEYYLNKIDEFRSNYNRKPLKIDSRLTSSANAKAQDMVNNGYFSHFGQKAFYDFIWASSPDAVFVGENLAKCYPNRDAAFSAFVNSSSHRAVLLGHFDDFGVAEVTDPKSGCVYTVLHFADYQ